MSYEVDSKTLPGGHRVVVEYDQHPTSPREWDNVGTVVLHERCRYSFGDETASGDQLREIADDPNNIVLPVYLYDHSGITIRTSAFSCRWDSGQVGIIYCTKQRAIKEWGKKILTKKVREQVISYMQGEIEELDQYLTGQVFGYRIYDPEGNELDSCWGYMEEDYCMSEGVSLAKCREARMMEERAAAWRSALREARERRYWASRDIVTTTE